MKSLAGTMTIVAVLIVIFGPLAVIFALNTLFPLLNIPYGFSEWISVVILVVTGWFICD